MTTFKLITAAVGAAFFATSAQAITILGYTSSNTDGSLAPTVEAAGVSGYDLTRGPGLVPNGGSTYNSRDWTETDLAGAEAAGDFLVWGFTSTTAFDVSTLDIRYDRSATGAMDIEIFASFNFDNNIYSVHTDDDIGVNGENNFGIDLSGVVGSNYATEAFFVLYGFGATGSSGTFDIENSASIDGLGIRVSGGFGVVPLPATMPLLLGAFGMLGFLRARRKSA